MAGIFISYRRVDAAADAARLREDLQRRFTGVEIFMDLSILAGQDFRTVLQSKLDTCDAVLALIGPRWLAAADPASGLRRLDDERDFVRIEIATALQLNKLVVPMLLGGTRMPGEAELPDAIRELAWKQAVDLPYRYWKAGVDELAAHLSRTFGFELATEESAPRPMRAYVVLVSGLILGLAHVVTVSFATVDPLLPAAGFACILGLLQVQRFRLSHGAQFRAGTGLGICATFFAYGLTTVLWPPDSPQDLNLEILLNVAFALTILLAYMAGGIAGEALRSRKNFAKATDKGWN